MGCEKNECKRMEVIDTFRKGQLDILGVFETRLRGIGIIEANGVKGVC